MENLDFKIYRKLIYSYIDDRNDAEDIYHNALIKVIQTHTDLENIKISYVWTAVQWAIMDHLREIQAHRRRLSVIDWYNANIIQPNIDHQDLLRDIMDQAPLSVRLFFQGYTNKEISEKLGDSITALKIRKHKFIKKIRSQYGEIWKLSH